MTITNFKCFQCLIFVLIGCRKALLSHALIYESSGNNLALSFANAGRRFIVRLVHHTVLASMIHKPTIGDENAKEIIHIVSDGVHLLPCDTVYDNRKREACRGHSHRRESARRNTTFASSSSLAQTKPKGRYSSTTSNCTA